MVAPVLVGGSRALPASAVPLVRQLVAAVVASGACVHVGCAVGADQAAVLACPSSSLVVFAAFASSGAGGWRCSAVSAVQAAARRGARVSWLAGGSLAVPLVGRLMSRSRAALRGCGSAVFFQPGPGSLAVAGFAVAAGVPVWAVSPSAPPPPRGCVGSWVAGSVFGLSAWSWVPAASQPALL